MMHKGKKIAQKVKKVLAEGEMNVDEPKKAALDQLKPKYEIRVQTMLDPIVEETHIIRKHAEEVDDRYGQYLDKIPDQKAKKDRQ